MKIDRSRDGSALALVLEGRLDTLTAPELERALAASLEGIEALTLDFSKVDYVSSAGLRTLFGAQKRMATKQGSMKLTGVNDGVMEVLRMTGFTEVLKIEPVERNPQK
ncbi:MAG: STAS domain-containing protein [Betaproteobacteria bacterium]|nr:STAS domain-containing protein [Betaproteobacteria bacterium]